MAEPLLIAARHEASASGAAIRPTDVAVGEPDAVLRDRVDVGRGNIPGKTLARELTPTEIVGEDDEDVGLAFGGRGDGGERREDAGEQEREGYFHFQGKFRNGKGGGERNEEARLRRLLRLRHKRAHRSHEQFVALAVEMQQVGDEDFGPHFAHGVEGEGAGVDVGQAALGLAVSGDEIVELVAGGDLFEALDRGRKADEEDGDVG